MTSTTRPSTAWGNSPLRYLLLSLYWLPITLFWGMMLGQVLPARVEDFSGPVHKGEYLAIISVIGAAAAAVIQLVIGPISDHCRSRLGRRRPFLLVGTAVASVAMLGFAWAHSFLMLTICFFVIQLFLNIANGPYQAFIPDHVPERHQGIASSYMGLMQMLGEAGGPVLVGFAVAAAMKRYTARGVDTASPAVIHAASLARLHVFQHLIVLDVLLLIAAVLITAVLIPDPPAEDSISLPETMRSLIHWDIAGNRSFFWLLVSRGVYNLGFYIALAYLQYYVIDSLGLGLRYATPLMLLQVLTIVGALLGTFPAGASADRLSKKTIVYISCAFSAVATVAFALAHSVDIAYVSAFGFGIGYGAFRAVDWAFACNLLPPKGGAAKYMAIWSLSATLPQVLSPAFGPAADSINRAMGVGAGWRAAMLVAAGCVACGALVIRKVREKIPEAL